ncbi:MAG: hypothetical protein ABI024_06035 [Vicinamibacterales bacterium]
MRVCIVCAASVWLTAAPVFAQNPEVTGPKTLTAANVMCTSVPVVHRPIPRLTVFGPHAADGRSVATNGILVVKRLPDDGLAVGRRYVTQRLHSDLKGFGAANEGYADLQVTGWVTVKAIDDVNALAEVDLACGSIEIGDMLEPYVELTLPAAPAPLQPPDFSDRANVLTGADGRIMFGDGDVMSIERGTLHSVVAGARYAIYRDFHNGMPLVHVGDAVVLETAEQTSKVAITRVLDPIQPGDIAVPRRKP